jgi:uncharacterized protein (TIGR02453 family)
LARIYFTAALFEFLSELKANNRRDWFDVNRQRYIDDVQEPMLAFIAAFGERLSKFSAHLVADPRKQGGSMFRIHRDTRFSRDKRPYKTAAAATFTHATNAGRGNVPGFYLHLEPENSLGGGGIYHPPPDTLKNIRDRIVAKPSEWKKVRADNLPIEGDSLKRVPSGYDAEHPFAEDLKRKNFFSLQAFTADEVCSADFMDRYVDVCRSTLPLVRFQANALELPW